MLTIGPIIKFQQEGNAFGTMIVVQLGLIAIVNKELAREEVP